MYVPEIRCNGAETRLTVTDAKGMEEISDGQAQGLQLKQ